LEAKQSPNCTRDENKAKKEYQEPRWIVIHPKVEFKIKQLSNALFVVNKSSVDPLMGITSIPQALPTRIEKVSFRIMLFQNSPSC
jgi:hypothetical protein